MIALAWAVLVSIALVALVLAVEDAAHEARVRHDLLLLDIAWQSDMAEVPGLADWHAWEGDR